MAGTDYAWYLLALIPVISSTIGYVTNLVAVKALFHPVNFVGVRPIGWQGIVPAHSVKLARTMYQLINSRLLRFRELFDKSAVEDLLEQYSGRLETMTRKLVTSQAEAQFKPMWDALGGDTQEQVLSSATQEVRGISKQVIGRLLDDIESFIDLEPVVVNSARDNRELMGRIFHQVGANEFKFIERSGLYFGFLFGLVQLGIWLIFPAWWILPFFGFLVGYATNWVALKLIFEPREPKRILGLTVQGLFHRRQHQVAADFSTMVADNVMTDEALFAQMTRDESRARVVELVREAAQAVVEKYRKNPMFGGMISDEMVESLEGELLPTVEAELFAEDGPMAAMAHKSADIRAELHKRLAELPPEPFENVLRPAFKQDEWKLILMGAALGLLAGILQLVFLFGDALL